MSTYSKHIEEIISKHNRTANVQVVFLDIEKYSKRRTLTQTQVIDAFTDCLSKALREVAQAYVDFSQKNDLNFSSDIISLPTGDGAAVIFSFEGLHDIHLQFAKSLLKNVHEKNQEGECTKFNELGWCNCHSNFFVRIGVSEGKGILYKDVNGGYNLAGGVINMASRVMNVAERNQILFTKEAFDQIVDMVDDPNLSDKFVEYKDVEIKHGVKLSMFHFIGTDEVYINRNPPEDLMLFGRMKEAKNRMAAIFPGLPDTGHYQSKGTTVEITEKLVDLMKLMKDKIEPPLDALQGNILELPNEKEENG